jgi:hypothetical protein
LGTTTLDSQGSFKATFTLPSGLKGTQNIVAEVGAGTNCGADPEFSFTVTPPIAPVAQVSSTVEAASVTATNAATTSSSSGLASTGFAVAAYSVVAVALIAGGILLILTTRRRRSSH